MTRVIEVSRQPDGSAFYLHFTGGFRAARISPNNWMIVPVYLNGKPCATGSIASAQLKELAREHGFREIAFQQVEWRDGVHYSSWSPMTPGKTNHRLGPADYWSNIAGNLSRARTADFFRDVNPPTEESVAAILDGQSPIEALAQYISHSLRSMDLGIEKIVEHYHEQLTNHMAAGKVSGERSADTSSQTLYAHVHSFLLHLGAVRDYFGAAIAYRIGFDGRVDSMVNLVRKLRRKSLPHDAMLDLLLRTGNVVSNPDDSTRFVLGGWMKEATDIRNGFVHRRPYGSKFNERFGYVIPVSEKEGIYRYSRALSMQERAEPDVLDLLHHHYSQCNWLLLEAASVSGLDASILHLTDKDIISIKVDRGDAGLGR